MFFDGGGTKVRGANYEGWVVVTSAALLIVEAEAHGALQCSYVLTIDFVVFQPRHGVEVRPRFFDGGKSLSTSNADKREAAGCFLPDILSDHVQD